jgi:hypothetical protein
MRLGQVALQILAYLSTHRAARDTAEGIAEWWLLEQRIRGVIAEVKKALAELVARRLVLERTGRDGRVHYQLNPRQARIITRQLQDIAPVTAGAASGGSTGSVTGGTTRRK